MWIRVLELESWSQCLNCQWWEACNLEIGRGDVCVYVCMRNLSRYVYSLLFKRNENRTLFLSTFQNLCISSRSLLSQWSSFRCVSWLFLSWVQVVSLLQMREHSRALKYMSAHSLVQNCLVCCCTGTMIFWKDWGIRVILNWVLQFNIFLA